MEAKHCYFKKLDLKLFMKEKHFLVQHRRPSSMLSCHGVEGLDDLTQPLTRLSWKMFEVTTTGQRSTTEKWSEWGRIRSP